MRRPSPKECAVGPVIAKVRKAPVVGNFGNLTVHLVDASVPLQVRQAISHVAMVAQRSMSEYPAGYDGTVTEDDQRLYVLVDGDRVVAFALTALDERFWRLSWATDGAIDLFEDTALSRRGPKVGRVWVAASYRGKGLSVQLVEVAAGHLAVAPSELGWELPFTPAGRALVRHFCQSSFLGCGDVYSLTKALNSKCSSTSAT